MRKVNNLDEIYKVANQHNNLIKNGTFPEVHAGKLNIFYCEGTIIGIDYDGFGLEVPFTDIEDKEYDDILERETIEFVIDKFNEFLEKGSN